MTVPLNVQPPKAAEAAVASAAAVRKRRRRAPAGGAADDCFTCSKRNVKCDRRRPYCSQCLEFGNECSGYKTQLTWGVGVASRGKLRGLSLPIAKAPPVSNSSAGPGSMSAKKVAAQAQAQAAAAAAAAAAVSASMTSTTGSSLGSPVPGALASPLGPFASLGSLGSLNGPGRARAESMASVNGPWTDHDVLAAMSAHNANAHAMATPRALRHDDVDLGYDRTADPSISTPPFASYEVAGSATPVHMPISISVPVTLAHQNWATSPSASTVLSPFSSSLPTDAAPYHSQQQQRQQQQHHNHHHPQPRHKGPGPTDLHLSGSLDSLSDIDYMSPITHTFSADEVNFMNSPAGIVYDNFHSQGSPVPQSPTGGLLIEHRRPAPTSCPGLAYGASEPSSSLPSSHPDNYDATLSAQLLECESMGTPDMDGYSTSAQSAQYWGTYENDAPVASPQVHSEPAPPATPAWQGLLDSPSTSIHSDLVAKMPFFIDYYENTMCPSMVFIDGPNNPFRYHIMQLARSSRSLQHAICALAACNLRMKRRLSRGQHTREVSEAVDEPGNNGGSGNNGDQAVSEEYQHRNLAVHLLNEQLNDPVKSRHDSALATILLLCHYRMAESGIARFHTHFAGVKKILAMRRQPPFAPSRDYAWMEALFTYFDAISASINDREAQLDGAFLGSNTEHILPPGSENLVGCDRELFRTIIKLGRLNLLSQSRQVKDANHGAGGCGNNNGGSSNSNNSNSNSAISRALAARSQGTGLGQQLYGSSGSHGRGPHGRHPGGDMYSRFGPGGLDDDEALGPAAYEDQRSLFWAEWKEARLALQSWEFDAPRVVSALHGVATLTTGQLRDLCSLSEAFRYAALLYTERLANPTAPSSDSSFRNFVSQVVYYATSLETGSSAEKFLLWPLFVAGSECVNELQQTIVRAKCQEIMSRSGYMNNLAALDVLEHLWTASSRPEDKRDRSGQAPFNWNRCIGGPGIEVEWIMF